MEDKELEELIASANKQIASVTEKSDATPIGKLPSNMSILLSGVNNVSGLNILFSGGVDSVLGKLMDAIISGKDVDFDKIEKGITGIFDKIGLGEGSFEGPISKTVIGTIQDSMNSTNYLSMKNKIGKARLVLKNLEKKKGTFNDPELEKKYKETLKAIKSTLKFTITVYKHRRLINDKVQDGLKHIVAS